MNSTPCPIRLASRLAPCPGTGSRGRCPVERCDYAQRILESIHLMQLGARTGLASQVTGLQKKTLKQIYRQLKGKPSPSGQLPFSDTWFLENDWRWWHITLIWHLYRRLNPSDSSQARVLIDIFEVYSQLTREPMLDLTRTAFAIQLFATGLWTEHRCSDCGMAFAAPADHNPTPCPGCQLYYRYRCRWCGSALSPKSRGVRRKSCTHCRKKLEIGFPG